jgi:catechol 2,3-dioxygenase
MAGSDETTNTTQRAIKRTDGELLPPETRLGRTALTVSEIGELTDFYRDIVGLSVLSREEATAVLGVDDNPLLVLEHDPEAPSRHRSEAGLFHNAFRVPSRAALGDAVARSREHWQLGGASDHGVSEAVYLTDPEGNGIEIYRDHPLVDWPRGDDGKIRMGTYYLDLEPLEAAAEGGLRFPAGTDLGHVHLEVTSLEAFSDFYVDTIGFDVQTKVPAALFVAAGGYHHHIGANTWNHRSSPASSRGLSWFEVVVPDSTALNGIRERTVDNQYSMAETDDGVSVRGPDEIEVRVRI